MLLATLVLPVCGDTQALPPGPVGLPAAFFETDARNVLRREVREGCDAIGISTGLTSALRRIELASATRPRGHWEFRVEGKVAQVYPSGKVSGDLLPHLTDICQKGNQ